MRLKNTLKSVFCIALLMALTVAAPAAAASQAQSVNQSKAATVSGKLERREAQGNAEINEQRRRLQSFDQFAEEVETLLENDQDLSASALADSFQTKRLIVKSSEPVADNLALESVAGYNNIYIFQYETVQQAKEAYQRFLKMESVLFVEPDEVVSTQFKQTEEVYAARTETFYSWGVSQMKMDQFQQYLQRTVKDPEDVVVAVIDTGLNPKASNLFANRILEGKSFVMKDDQGSFVFKQAEYADDNGHGTAVAGIIAESTPENVKILPIKSLNAEGKGTELVVYLGINYALSYNVDVINMSCGVQGESYIYNEAMRQADLLGVTVVAAAGNESQNVANISPACIDSVIAVSSYDEDMSFSYFSNFGDQIDFAAPGGKIKLIFYKGGTFVESGTSFSTPHITAAIALMLCARPDLFSDDILYLLKEYATDIGLTGWDRQYGYGWINMERLEKPLLTYSLLRIGDVDEDGEITVLDALTILQEASGEIDLSSRQMAQADVDRDGKITVSDALRIMEFIIGKETSNSLFH